MRQPKALEYSQIIVFVITILLVLPSHATEKESILTKAKLIEFSSPLKSIGILESNQESIDRWPAKDFFDAYFLLIQLHTRVGTVQRSQEFIKKLDERLSKNPSYYPWIQILKAQSKLAMNKQQGLDDLFESDFTVSKLDGVYDLNMWHDYLQGVVLVRQNQFAEALRKLTSALEATHTLDAVYVRMLVLSQLVEMSYFMTDYDAAIEYSGRLLELSRSLNDAFSEVAALTFQMNTYYTLGTEQAILYEEETSAEKKEKIANVFQVHQDEFDKLQMQVLRKSEKIGATQSRVRALVMQQNRLLDSENYTDAIKVCEETIDIALQNNLSFEAAVSYNNLAIAMRLLSRHKEGIDALKKAEQLYQTLAKEQSLLWVLEDFAIAYELDSQYFNALTYYKKFHRASMKTLKKTNNETVLELQEFLSSREKEREIERLNQQKQLRENQLQTERLWITLLLVTLFATIVILWLQFHKRKRFKDLFHQETQLRTQLSEMSEAKTRFFTNISHEFRTSLTLAIGPLKSLLREQEVMSKLHQEQIHSALENNLHMMSLLGEVLDINRLELRGMPISLVKINVAASLDVCLDRFGLQFKSQQLSIVKKGFDNAPSLYFDPDHFDKIFANLLSNALKYSKDKSTVEVVIHERLDEVAIQVIDQGMGIDSQELPHIFDRFYQGQRSSSLQSPGTGIGLSFVKELVSLHKGTIDVDSEVNQGTKFTVTIKKGHSHYPVDLLQDVADNSLLKVLPTHLDTDQNSSQIFKSKDVISASSNESASNTDSSIDMSIPNSSDMSNSQKDSSKMVLIVEDNLKIRRLLRTILQPFYQVIEAENGQVGLKLALDLQPDVIVSDVMMPVMDGFEFTAAIKSNKQTSHIYLILLTAKTSKEDTLLGLTNGADDYIYKPFDDQELLARIDNCVAQKQRLSLLLQGKYTQSHNRVDYKTFLSNKGGEFSRKLDALIDEHIFDSDFDVEQMYSKLKITRSALFRQAKKSYGVSPKQILKTRRLEAAYQMLKDFDGTVSEVAYAVGFQSLSSFSRAFREHFNTPPTKIDELKSRVNNS